MIFTKKRTKRPFSLIEILLGLSIMAMLLSFLFSSLTQSIKLSSIIHAIQNDSLKNGLLYGRLSKIFDKSNHNTILFLKNPTSQKVESISFEIDNAIDPQTMFSGKVFVKIYNDNSHLVLELSSQNKKHKRKEILFENFSHLQWEEHLPFFITLSITDSKNNSKKTFAFFLPSYSLNQPGFPI